MFLIACVTLTDYLLVVAQVKIQDSLVELIVRLVEDLAVLGTLLFGYFEYLQCFGEELCAIRA